MEKTPFFLADNGLSGFMIGLAVEEEEEEDENNNNVRDEISKSQDHRMLVDQNSIYQQYQKKSEEIGKDGLCNTKSSELDMNSSNLCFSPLCISQSLNAYKIPDTDCMALQRTSQGQIAQGKIPASCGTSHHRTPQLPPHHFKESETLSRSNQEILLSHNKEPQGQDYSHHQKKSQVLEPCNNESGSGQGSRQKKSQALSSHSKELGIQQGSHENKSQVLTSYNNESGIQQGSHQNKSQALSSHTKEFGIQQGLHQKKSQVLTVCNNKSVIQQGSHEKKPHSLTSDNNESVIQQGSNEKKSQVLTSYNNESGIQQGSHQKKSHMLTSYINESEIQQGSYQKKSHALSFHNKEFGIQQGSHQQVLTACSIESGIQQGSYQKNSEALSSHNKESGIQQGLHQKNSQEVQSHKKEPESQQGQHKKELHIVPFHNTEFEIQQGLNQGTTQVSQLHNTESRIQQGSHQKASRVIQLHSTEFGVQQESHQKTSQTLPFHIKESESQQGLHQKKSQVVTSDSKDSGIQQRSHQKTLQVLQSQNTEFRLQQGSIQKKPQVLPSHNKEFGMRQASHQRKSQVLQSPSTQSRIQQRSNHKTFPQSLRSNSTQSGLQQGSHPKASQVSKPDSGSQYRSHQKTSQKLLSHNREPGSELQKLTQMLPFHNREHESQKTSLQKISQARHSSNKESVIQLESHQKTLQKLPSQNREFRNQQGSHQKKSQLPPYNKESGIQQTSQLLPRHSTEVGIQQGSHQGVSHVSSVLPLNKESGIQQASHHKTSQGLLSLNKTYPTLHQKSLQMVTSPSQMHHAHARSHQKMFQTSSFHSKRSEIHLRSHQKAPPISLSGSNRSENLPQRASHASFSPGKIFEHHETFTGNQEASQSPSISKTPETCQIPPHMAEQLLPSAASILEAFQATLDKTAKMLLSSINKSKIQQTTHQTTAQMYPSKSESTVMCKTLPSEISQACPPSGSSSTIMKLPVPVSDPSGHDSNCSILQTHQNSALPSLDCSCAKSQDKNQNELNTKRDSSRHIDSEMSEEILVKIRHNHNVDSRRNEQMKQLKIKIKVIPTEGVLLFDHTSSPWPVCTESPPILNAGVNSSRPDYQKPYEISLPNLQKHRLTSNGSKDPRIKEERPRLPTRINTGQEVPIPQHNKSELRHETTDHQMPLSDLNNQAGPTVANQFHTHLENKTQNQNTDDSKTQSPHSDSASVDRNDNANEVKTQSHSLGIDTTRKHISSTERRIQRPPSHVDTRKRNGHLNEDRPVRGMKRGHDHLNEDRMQCPRLHKDTQENDHLNDLSDRRVERHSLDLDKGIDRKYGNLDESMGRTESHQSDKDCKTRKVDDLDGSGFESPHSERNAKGTFENCYKNRSGSAHSDKTQSNTSRSVTRRYSKEWKRPLKHSWKSPIVEREIPGKKRCLGKISQRSRFGTFNRHKVLSRPRLAQSLMHGSKAMRKCRYCQFSTPWCNKLDEHLAHVHGKRKIYFCSFRDCNLSFVLAKTLDAHESRHRKKIAPSPSCPVTWDSQRELHHNVNHLYSRDLAPQMSYPTDSQSTLTLIEHQGIHLTDYQVESVTNECFSESAGISQNMERISDYPLNRTSAHDTDVSSWRGESSVPDEYIGKGKAVVAEFEEEYRISYTRPSLVQRSVSPERPRSYHQDCQRDSKRAAEYPFVPQKNYRDQNRDTRRRNSGYFGHNRHSSGNRWNERGHNEYYNQRDLDHYDHSREWNGNGAGSHHWDYD